MKLRGPMFSRAASGKLGTELQIDNRRRGPVLGLRRRPAQPRTIAQLATRKLMALLTTQWRQLTPAEQLTWSNYAPTPLLPNYQAYLQHNVDRFKNLPGNTRSLQAHQVHPSAAYPTTKATNEGSLHHIVHTGGEGQIHYEVFWVAANDNWLLTIHNYLPPTGYPSYRNLLGIWPVHTSGVSEHVITGLTPGTYNTLMIPISRTGLPRAVAYQDSNIVVT